MPSGLPCDATAQIVVADSAFKQLLASAQLEDQASKLEDASEWEECEVLRRLVRVNQAQHRRTDYFSRVRGVVRCIWLHERLAAAKHTRGSVGGKGVALDTSDVGPHRVKAVVPSREQAVDSLMKLHNSAVLCTKLVQLTVAACERLFSQMTISLYNVFLPLSAAFPLHARGSTTIGDSLPESLGIKWSHGIPKVLVHSFALKDGYKQLVEATGIQYNLKHFTQATTASVAGSKVRIEQVMATRSTIAENVSLPVFASTRPCGQDAVADVKFSLPNLKCFQRAKANCDVLPETIQESEELSDSPEISPEAEIRSTESSKPLKAVYNPSRKALRKAQGSGVSKPALLDWKAVLNKQRKGKQTNTPVKVSALEDMKMQGRDQKPRTVLSSVKAKEHPQSGGKQARPASKGANHDLVNLLMQGSSKP